MIDLGLKDYGPDYRWYLSDLDPYKRGFTLSLEKKFISGTWWGGIREFWDGVEWELVEAFDNPDLMRKSIVAASKRIVERRKERDVQQKIKDQFGNQVIK